MDKKYLRELPRPQADPSFIDRARADEKMRWLFTAADHDGTIELDAYYGDDLRSGGLNARYRLFFDDLEYISQDLRTEKTKWLTGKATNLLEYGWWGNWERGEKRHTDMVFADDVSRKIMEDRFGAEIHRENGTVWDGIYHWQENVLQRKLRARHEKELQHTRDMMALVPELPPDFDSWIDGYAMYDKRFLIYDANPKAKMRRAFCTHCGKTMMIDPKKVRLRMNERSTCPECESQVTCRPKGRFPVGETHRKYAAIIQRTGEKQILVRHFLVTYTFRRDDLLDICKKERGVMEMCREFLTGIGKERKKESFEFAVYKQEGNLRWCPDTDKINCGLAVLYTNGLRETLAGTEYQYSGLEVFQEVEGCNQIPLWKYLDTYPETKELETLVKAGLTNLASDIVLDPYVWRTGGFKKRGIPADLSKLTKEHRRVLRDLNGGQSIIAVLREFELCRNDANADAVKNYITTFGGNTKLVRDLTLRGIKVQKFTRYTQKQMKMQRRHLAIREPQSIYGYGVGENPRDVRYQNVEKTKNFLRDWDDYIAWSADLGYNLKDEYVLMPPDFRKAHDRLMEEEKRKKDELMRKKQEKINRKINEMLKDLQGIDPMHMKSKKLMIVIPSSAEDLKREGQILHHCVGTYAERVAKGETTILFIRKTAKPDEPYFTMEWRNDKVQQCRGKRNCDMTPDVKAFVTAFEKKMNEPDEDAMVRQKVRVS